MSGDDEEEDLTAALGRILERVGARVTFDPERSTAKPCIGCRSTQEPRFLIEIGVWTMDLGNFRSGDPIFRPICSVCAMCPTDGCERFRGHDGLHSRKIEIEGITTQLTWVGEGEKP